MSVSDHYYDEINDPERLAEQDRQEPSLKAEMIRAKMMEANQARTDLLSIHPEINSEWTPDAIEKLKGEKK